MLSVLFWGSAALLFYTFIGYRYLLRALPYRPIHRSREQIRPTVTVVVVAHNEADRIEKRLQNLLTSDYPAESLRVVLVTDGCTDNTAVVARSCAADRLTVIESPQRRGKPHGLNLALAQCSSDIVVFADARQSFARDTIAKLVAPFGDPRVGAVSGDLQIQGAASGVGSAVDRYWQWEKQIRRSESLFDSCIGCTGAVYAIRRGLFCPIPEDTILDDVVIPMQIAMRGFRIIHEESAIASDPQTLEPEREKIRKRRTLAGNFQVLCRYPSWLLPWKNRLCWQLISHKYLRLAAPVLLSVCLLSSGLLLSQPLYLAAFAAQCLFYLLAFVGLGLPGLRVRILSLPAGFVFLNARVAESLLYYLRNRNMQGWSTPKG